MTIVLATKPGINGANTLSIPAEWDAAWFRRFIANLLKGADVRNAVGTGGLVVSGNISSPYATIGFVAPVTLPGPVTINGVSGSSALTINAVSSANPAQGIAVFNDGVHNAEIVVSTSTAGDAYYRVVDLGQTNWSFGERRSDGSFIISESVGLVNPVFGITKTTSQISGFGTTAAGLVTMSPDRGTFTMSHTGFTTAVTSTATWYKIGNLVIINTGTVTGTSNATTWTGTGVPTAIQPTLVGQTITIGDAEDNGVGTAATVVMVSGSGTITFGKGFGASGAWTNAGAKGFINTGGTTFCYILG